MTKRQRFVQSAGKILMETGKTITPKHSASDVPTVRPMNSRKRQNPVEECDHEETETEYLEEADGQHEIVACEECNLVLEDKGNPEPSNVGESDE